MPNAALCGAVEVDHVAGLGCALAAHRVQSALLEPVRARGCVIGEPAQQRLRGGQAVGFHEAPVHEVLAPLILEVRRPRPLLHVAVVLRVVVRPGVAGEAVQVGVGLLFKVASL